MSIFFEILLKTHKKRQSKIFLLKVYFQIVDNRRGGVGSIPYIRIDIVVG